MDGAVGDPVLLVERYATLGCKERYKYRALHPSVSHQPVYLHSRQKLPSNKLHNSTLTLAVITS